MRLESLCSIPTSQCLQPNLCVRKAGDLFKALVLKRSTVRMQRFARGRYTCFFVLNVIDKVFIIIDDQQTGYKHSKKSIFSRKLKMFEFLRG